MNTLRMDEAVAYVDQLQPGFAQGLIGALPAELDELQQAIGARALPLPYRQCLQRVGHGLALARLTPARYDVQDLIARYRHGHRAPANFWLLGPSTADPYYDVYLFSRQDDESRVVCFPQPPRGDFAAFARQHLTPLAGNAAQWIAGAAFMQHRLPPFKHVKVLESAAPQAARLNHCDAALRQLGLKPLWFSDDWMRYYETDGGVAVATELPGAHTVVMLRAGQADRLSQWAPAVHAALRA